MIGLMIIGIYKLYVFEETGVYDTDEYLLIDSRKNLHRLKVEDNQLVLEKVDNISSINLTWDTLEKYVLGLKVIIEFNFDEIDHEKKYKNGNYTYLIDYFATDDRFLFGFVLGFDELKIVFTEQESADAKKMYYPRTR